MPAPKEKAQPKTPSVTPITPANSPQVSAQPVNRAQNSVAQSAAAASPASAATTTQKTPSREELELAAYALYLERGAIDGFAVEDWLQAERELIDGAEAQRKARAKGA